MSEEWAGEVAAIERRGGSAEALSCLLQSVRIESVRLVRFEIAGPFSLSMPDLERAAEDLRATPDRVLVLHLVAAGACWASGEGASTALTGGASLLAPGCAAHRVSCTSSQPARVLDALAVARGAGRSSIRLGDGELCASLVTALVRLARPLPAPVRAALASTPLVASPAGPADPLVSGLLACLADASGDDGGEWVRSLLELQLRSILRRALASDALSGWVRGTEDARVARCLALLHSDLAHPWSLAELARRAYASKSTLSLRFAELVGEPPMQYLSRLRLERARERLAERDATLAGVAAEVGYESHAAFQRAFKRAFGVPPGVFRRGAVAAAERPRRRAA